MLTNKVVGIRCKAASYTGARNTLAMEADENEKEGGIHLQVGYQTVFVQKNKHPKVFAVLLKLRKALIEEGKSIR